MQENEADEFQSGFGENLKDIYLNYDTINEKIYSSDPRNTYWLIDLHMKGGYKIAKKLIEEHFSNIKEFQNHIKLFPARIRADSDYLLALSLIAILEKRGIPVAANSTANMAIPDYRTVAEHYKLIDYPISAHSWGTISKAAEQILSDIKERLQNPVERFLSQIRKVNCHIDDGGFECFDVLADFLDYSGSDELMGVLGLGSKRNYSGSLIEESLKILNTGGANGYSMIGMILICWAAYRSVERSRDDFSDSFFPTLLASQEEAYRKALQRNPEKVGYYRKLARSASLCPPQDFVTFKKTLRAYSDMIRPLFVNDTNGKPTLESLALVDETFMLNLSISTNLIRTLNEVQFNFLDAIDTGRFTREHTTSMRIYRYCYYNSLSTRSENQSDGIGFSSSFWGSKSFMNITPFKSEKGVKIKFSLCSN